MPTKKRKYEARFPTARIKKIMQTDEEIGKVAAAVPVIISRALEIFLQQLVEKTADLTKAKRAKTMTTGHLKQCIESEKQFDFLKDLVANIAEMPNQEEEDTGDSGETKAKKPRKQRAAGEKKKNSSKKAHKSSSSNDSDEEEASDNAEETPTVFPRSTSNNASNRTKDKPENQTQSTSTISRPEDDASREKTFNTQTSLNQPVIQPSQSIPMMLKSRDDDEEDYDEDD
eukprot:Seg541.4 transcript_id=Seg541.4/GoldUCD/mRNA.D3Y31 product="Dr1-associated corepressor" protein_id=Seg541.4/GoldUCD/D3Y31